MFFLLISMTSDCACLLLVLPHFSLVSRVGVHVYHPGSVLGSASSIVDYFWGSVSGSPA